MSYIGGVSTGTVYQTTIASDKFSGNGSQVNFTLSRSVVTANDIEVIVNNVQQSPHDGSYSVNGTTLTFSAAPSSGTDNIYVTYRTFSIPNYFRANTTVEGVVALLDSVSNTSVTKAATPNAVKMAYELAGNAVSNASSYAATAYSNAVATANTTSYNQAANAYANAVSHANTVSDTAYTNAVSQANTIAYNYAANAYANVFLGGTFSNTIIVEDVIPVNNSYSLGNSTNRFADLWVANSSIHIGDVVLTTNTTGLIVSNGQLQSTGNTTFTNVTVTGNTIANNINLNGNLQIDGNLTVGGNTITLNVTELAVEDNMIYLNANSQVSNPDLGFVGNYNDGTYRHAGVFRDATDGTWKFFHQYEPEPDANVFIDTANSTFALANVQANTFIGNLSGDASTVGSNTASDLRNYSANASNISTGTLDTARLPATANVSTVVNVGANVNLTTSSISVGNSTVNTALTSSTLSVGNTAYFVANGNVGIGTSTPQVKFQVAGDVTTSIGPSFNTNIYYDSGTASNKYLANGFGGVLTIAESGSGGFRFYTAPNNSSGSGASATITERMRIDTNGNVRIGTTSTLTGYRLGLSGGSIFLSDVNKALTGGGNIQMYASDSQAADIGPSIGFGGFYIGTSSDTEWAQLAGRKENSTSGNYAGYLQFSTRANGGNVAERMRIDSSGNLDLIQSANLTWRFAPASTIRGTISVDSADIMYFRTGSSNTERMRITSAGNISIGLTGDAVGGAPGSTNGRLNIYSSTGSGFWVQQIRSDSTTGNGLFLRAGANSSYYTAYLTGYDENNVHLVVRGDGNVGIGINSPVSKLDVNGAIRTRTGAFVLNDGTTQSGGIYQEKVLSGSGTSLATSIFSETGLPIRFCPNGSAVESARITSGGQFLVGATSASTPFNSTSKIVSQGDFSSVGGEGFGMSVASTTGTGEDHYYISFQTATTTQRGYIYYNNGAGQVQLSATSDARLKENIVDAPSALPVLEQVKVRQYDWKETGSTNIGFVAQELHDVIPRAVAVGQDNEDGTIQRAWGVNNASLVPYLVKAIQELNAKVEAQAAEIAALRNN